MENSRETKIEKIPLQELIDTLVSLYNKGIDYVDIVGIPGEEFDRMAIAFTKDYMTEEGMKNFGEMEIEIESNKKLTDEDLNQLI